MSRASLVIIQRDIADMIYHAFICLECPECSEYEEYCKDAQGAKRIDADACDRLQIIYKLHVLLDLQLFRLLFLRRGVRFNVSTQTLQISDKRYDLFIRTNFQFIFLQLL